MQNKHNSYLLLFSLFFLSLSSKAVHNREAVTPAYGELFSPEEIIRLNDLTENLMKNTKEHINAFSRAMQDLVESQESLFFDFSASQTEAFFNQLEGSEHNKIIFLKNKIFYYYAFLDNFSEYIQDESKKEASIEMLRKIVVFILASLINQTVSNLDMSANSTSESIIGRFEPVLSLLGFQQKILINFIDTLKQIHAQLAFLKANIDTFSYDYCIWKISKEISEQILSSDFFSTHCVYKLINHSRKKNQEKVKKLQNILPSFQVKKRK